MKLFFLTGKVLFTNNHYNFYVLNNLLCTEPTIITVYLKPFGGEGEAKLLSQPPPPPKKTQDICNKQHSKASYENTKYPDAA